MLVYNGVESNDSRSAHHCMKFQTIVNNPGLLKFGRRLLFSLLSVWVHFAALFYVTMVLFSRGENGPQDSPDSLRHQQKIEVSLKQPPVPQTAAPMPDEKVAEVKEKENPSLPKVPETPPVANKASEPANSSGVLNCDALTSKPRLIASGEGYMQIKNIDSTAGSMTLREKIHRDGTVIEVVIEKSTMSKKMEEQVINSAYHTVFSPGEMEGIPVDCLIRFEVSNDNGTN